MDSFVIHTSVTVQMVLDAHDFVLEYCERSHWFLAYKESERIGVLTIRKGRQIFHFVPQMIDVTVDTFDDATNSDMPLLSIFLYFTLQSILRYVVNRHALLGWNKSQLIHDCKNKTYIN